MIGLIKEMINLKNISKYYAIEDKKIFILSNLNISIKQGEFVSITGYSGSGKTTLLNIIGLIDTDYSGDYILDGLDVKKMDDYEYSKTRNDKIGYIFQKYNLIDTLNVLENIKLPVLYKNRNIKESYYYIEKVIDMLSLNDLLKKYPRQLSGGQAQKVTIARAIINKPKIIIADEPTGSLDNKSTTEIMEILKHLNKLGITIILVTHDDSLLSYSDKNYILTNKGLVFYEI